MRKWSSGQNSTSKSVLKYGDDALLAYTWYPASEIPFLSPPSIKFDKVLQLAAPKALPVFYVKVSDSWVETRGNVLHLDFYTCN